MSTHRITPARLKHRLLRLALALVLAATGTAGWPSVSSAAVPPLPGPGSPLVYDDFAGGGVYKQNWTNWYNQNGGSGSFSRTADGDRSAGRFTQTPATSSSWAKFQPMNEAFSISGYRYLKLSARNPGYPDSRIRINLNDGSKNYDLTGGWTAVQSTWTDLQFDLEALAPAIQKENVKLEIWLRQNGGAYGEVLIDDIMATAPRSGSQPSLDMPAVTANSEGVYNQNTSFTFSTTYTDADNEPPYAIQVVVDDTAYALTETDSADTVYTDGKGYAYTAKLPVGSHAYYFRATDATSDEVRSPLQSGLDVVYSEQTLDVVVSQAGYSSGDVKTARVVSSTYLEDLSYQILDGSGVVASGQMVDEGIVWKKHVYSIDFSSLHAEGSHYRVRSNNVTSYPFSVKANVWKDYRDEMTAFYRIMRSGVATADAYPAGYSSVEPSAKVFHGAGHLDDALSADGLTHYDLSGGWYDAGDYGKYGGNQWVGAEIALAYLRYANAESVKYDNDANGIPDLVDEAIFGSEYLIKFADQLGGEMYNLKNNASFVHPEKSTDNLPGTADDRRLSDLGVGGSAKSAGTLAATARAVRTAIAQDDVAPPLAAGLNAFADQCEAAAEVFYAYVIAHPDGPVGSYSTRGGIPNSKLLADVELYLLTGDPAYAQAAAAYINTLSFEDLASTNYWDMQPMSMAEFYPAADTATKAHIHSLLKQQLDFFLSSMDDTPYSVLNQFKNFGVNEPQASYLGDMLRYYELFGDPAALDAAVKGMYWIFGENPWNISWVSGIGSDYTDFLHTRFDEAAGTAAGTGIIIPGAMVSGPNIKDTKDPGSASPWYEDRSLYADDVSQWRYNEFSISIQAGLLYTIMGLSAADSNAAPAITAPLPLPVLSPVIGDKVRGNVTIFAENTPGVAELVYAPAGGVYQPMGVSGEVYSAVINESSAAPFTDRRIDVRGVDAAGRRTYSSTHYTVAPPLPDPSTPLLYDDFGGSGTWGGSSANATWVNWYNQNGGTGAFSKVSVDGRTAGKFTQTPASASSYAKFQPWHDAVDLSGYRYLNVTLKNPGYPQTRVRIELAVGGKTYNLTKGWAEVPADWTSMQFDLNAFVPDVLKPAATLAIWLKQESADYGELLVDEITATNKQGGSAPVISGVSVDKSSGDPQTEFTFSATYTDADNDAPFALELVLDGVIHQMLPVDSSDTNYTDGRTYRCTTRLARGQHSYYIHATDNRTDAVSSEVQSGPIVSRSVFADDFNDGQADGWTADGGIWTAAGYGYSGQAGTGQNLSIAGDAAWTDYTFEARVNVTNNTYGNKDAGLVFRYTDGTSYYLLALKNNDRTGRRMELVKVVNGVKTTLDYANPDIAADTFYRYAIRLKGPVIEVYKDGVLILNAVDSAHGSGKIGLRVYAHTRAVFDDISVTS
ncbi:glycoside hydrolase family 9 protein [Paenibacillus sp. S150]|uniref:glycoside hydrolase family 9 protein n=1 Tax=Paenibacillus sp. S150 TaxID=2749826 RepID=UPI001C5791BE|nr:glycoside hydrolase family 9 protein [Paenibacillus sp. S150]MBW4084157.1 glycoside hydrolase family 9 protein [Paenibacillus sp. S150]